MKQTKGKGSPAVFAVLWVPFGLAVVFFLFTWLYFGREPLLGAQDDLNLLNRDTFGKGSFFHNLWNYYIESSARLGEFGAFIAWSRWGGYFYQGDIYHYPWWFFKCLACFTYTIAVLQFTKVTARLVQPSDGYQRTLIAFAGWALLGTNALIPRTLLEIGTLLPAYALAVAFYSCVAAAVTRREAVPVYFTWLLVPLYFYCTVAHEQVFLLSAFLSFCWLTHSFLISGGLVRRTRLIAGAWLLLHGVAALIIVLSPGHRAKLEIAGGMSFSVKRWLTQLTLSFSDIFPFSPGITKFGFLIALSWAVFTLFRIWKSQKWDLGRTLSSVQGSRVYWALAFFGAGAFACATCLISKYFPERARLTPNVAFLCSALSIGVMGLDWLKAELERRLYQRVLLALTVALACFGLHSLSAQLPIWSQIANTDRIRLLTYSRLESSLKAKPAEPLHVTYCPPVFDAFWGIRSFRKWQAIPLVSEFAVDGVNEETVVDRGFDKVRHNEFSCFLRFPDFVETPRDGVDSHPVLKLVRNGKEKGVVYSAVRSYFPLRGDTRSCRGVITYHDSIDSTGHGLQTEVFEVAINRDVRDGLTKFLPVPLLQRQGLRFEVVGPNGETSPFASSEIDKPFFLKSLRRKQDLAGFLMVEVSPLHANALNSFFEVKLRCGL